MVEFKTYEEAVKYAQQQAKEGISCRPLMTMNGTWRVVCVFSSSGIPKEKEKEERPYIPLNQGNLIPQTPEPIKKISQEAFGYTINEKELRDYQKEALEAILRDKRITVAIPTGTGKTFIGIGLIAKLNLPSVIIVPTLVLVKQWMEELRKWGLPACEITGEKHLLCKFTVITYQSAILYPQYLTGFEVVVFDEVHHAYSPEFRSIFSYIHNAKYVLGLSATPIRQTERKFSIQQMNLPVGYEKKFKDLGEYVAPLTVENIGIVLSEQEKERYEKDENIIRRVTKALGPIDEWAKYTNSDNEQKKLFALRGFKAVQDMRKLLSESPEKMQMVVDIVKSNPGQFIVFTETVESSNILAMYFKQNAIPYVEINYVSGNADERNKKLELMKSGKAKVLIGIKSIEEGINLPDVANGIFLSSSRMGERYLTQRLGRILRPKEGKTAKLYFIYARGTREEEALKKVRTLV